MESPPEPAYSQVVFTDIPHFYPPSAPVTCCYTASFQPNSRDWVGIFKVGWSSTKDYHTFVWVEPSVGGAEQQAVSRQAVFKDYYLPKDEVEFYQFCYIDSTGKVRGASTPFCFRNLVEQSVESCSDNDLLVITTQEQVEQSVREKAELMGEVAQTKEENETLKQALQRGQEALHILKAKDEQRKKEMSELLKELDQMKKQNENLNQSFQEKQQENEQLKETNQKKTPEMDAAEKMSTCDDGASQHTQLNEKYNQAVLKISQLKEERQQLRGKLHDQRDDIAKLNSKLRDDERELIRLKDDIQLLEVDLLTSDGEKRRISAELQRQCSLTQGLDELKRENQELCRRISEQELTQPHTDDQLKQQTLLSQLEETRTELEAVKDALRKAQRHNQCVSAELQKVYEQLEYVNASNEQAVRKSNKQLLQLREAHEAIAEKDGILEDKDHMILLVKQENEELAREIQTLRLDIEALRKVCADLRAAPPADRSVSAEATAPPLDLQETPEQSEPMYDNLVTIEEAVEELLVCHHCHECFPGITPSELEQHEQSHRVCPICTLICDSMEQSVFEDHVYGHEL